MFVLLICLLLAAVDGGGTTRRCVSSDEMRSASGKLFGMSRERADAVRKTRLSGLPCSATPGFSGGAGEYMATFRSHDCITYAVQAPKGHKLTSCFVPDVVWFSLGRDHVLSDHTLCKCRNQVRCTQSIAKLDRATTYVMLIIAAPPTVRRRLGTSGLPTMPNLLPPPITDWTAHVHVTSSCTAAGSSAKTHATVIAGGAAVAALFVVFVTSRRGGGAKGYAAISTRGSSQRRALSSSSGL
jgi:hypothetical protein